MPYRAILFDLDGTLLDSLADLANSMNEALAAMGFVQHPLDAYRYFVGDGVEFLARRALPEDRRDEETVKRCIAAMRGAYTRRWNEKTRPYPGIPELLAALAGRGLRLTVLSNKPDDFTQKMVAALLPDTRFDLVRGALPNVPKKPDPAGAREIAATLGLAPADFLYLGDTGTDMKTAVGAGMVPVGVLWGFRPAVELLENGAARLIRAPEEALEIMDHP